MNFISSDDPFWGTFLGQFYIELLGGTISALIFLFLLLWLFKPKVSMANFICFNTTGGYYVFKFVNMSCFAAHDIHVELHKIRRIPMGSGLVNNEYEKLSLVNGHISHVPGRAFKINKNKANPHCILVRSHENINTILRDDMNAVALKISLKHGLTGLSNVFEQEFGNPEDVRTGKFKPGTKFGNI